MEIIRKGFVALLIISCISLYGCGPTDNKGGMDQENSKGEGAVDSTRVPNFDSTSNPLNDSTGK